MVPRTHAPAASRMKESSASNSSKSSLLLALLGRFPVGGDHARTLVNTSQKGAVYYQGAVVHSGSRSTRHDIDRLSSASQRRHSPTYSHIAKAALSLMSHALSSAPMSRKHYAVPVRPPPSSPNSQH
jgi:hypothetical protein